MDWEYTHYEAPDPDRSRRERDHVRSRHAEEYPMTAAAIDSVVAADLPLETAARDLYRLRRRMRAARQSRAAR